MKQPLNTPWWQPAVEKQPRIYVQKRNNSSIIVLVVVVSLIAGAIGATIGRSTTDNLGANLVQTENVVERAPGSIAALAARLIPAVVSITVNGSGGSGTGSGFFLDSDGYILTNNHVVESAANSGRIIVETSDGKKYPAKLIGRDNSYDLAVLKINVQAAPTLQLGNSDQVLVGDAVIAIGSPLGLSGTVTAGIISSKNRAVTTGNGFGESSFINALQTDAAINPGNSGGALIDVNGNLIGINTAIFSRSGGNMGIGFAIPAELAKTVMDSLISHGRVLRGWLGVEIASNGRSANGRESSDVFIAGVMQGGPADKAGLRRGDQIIEVAGQSVVSANQVIRQIGALAPKARTEIIVRRDGKVRKIDVTMGERPAPRA